jgi:hypothetical protein
MGCREGLFDQLLEPEFLQHRSHRKQPSVGRQIPRLEVIGRGSPDFIRLRSICVNPLIDGAVKRSLICIANHRERLIVDQFLGHQHSMAQAERLGLQRFHAR